MHPLVESGVTVFGLVAGLAVLSVILSRNATTVDVIHAGASAGGNLLGVAMSPVTGASYNIDLGYPRGGFGG